MELLAAHGITKYFPATRTLANDGVDLRVSEGEIRAVVGENGAGKSTLARILAGILRPDQGELLVRGTPLPLGSVHAAEAAGIGLVPQHSFLAESLTVAEALALGREPRRLGLFFDRRRAYVNAMELAERFGFRVDPEARVGALSPAERRQAEILRALARGGDLLILDEPTALLTEAETASLFALIRNLAAHGKAVLFITHRAAELRALATHITVLRGGRVAADLPAAELPDCELSRLMANAVSCSLEADRDIAGPGEALVEARDLVLGGRRAAAPLSFTVRRGEILGLIGLAGNGLDELEELAAGLARPRSGEFLIKGRPAAAWPRAELRRRHLGYVPADREGRGLALAASVGDNLLVLERRDFSRLDCLLRKPIDARARELASRLSLKADPNRPAWTLSGGNRQRLLLARELEAGRDALLLVDPTQGLDVAAQEDAAARILARKRDGAAILLLTSNIEELLLLADRVGILYRGTLVYEAPNDGSLAAQDLAAHMTGLGAA